MTSKKLTVCLGLLIILTISLPTTTVAQTTDALIITDTGRIGMGIASPARQLHLRGSNAVFRMDRSAGSAAFLLVRTTSGGSPLKTFVVGTNASGSNNGEFVINDLGTAVSGAGVRRLTITNNGEAQFTGTVRAPAFVTSSSLRYKKNVEQISDALALTQKLQGVRFEWKDTGQPALGFIAEEVAPVLPEVVEHDADNGQVVGVNYPALVAVLVEAVKQQQAELSRQQAELAALRTQVAARTTAQAKIASLEARLANIEDMMDDGRLRAAWVQR